MLTAESSIQKLVVLDGHKLEIRRRCSSGGQSMRLISAGSLVQIQSPPPYKINSGIDISSIGLIFYLTVIKRSFMKMTFWPFEKEDLHTVSEALAIAEDKTGDFYKFSFGQWKRHRYDIKTLLDLKNS